jgi:hypothetical protein
MQTEPGEQPAKRGRPRVITPEIEEAILRTVRLGLHAERAAQAHGINKRTLQRHRKANPDFVASIKEAEAAAEATFLGRIFMHMDKHWQSIAWMLERRWPERWSKREHVEVSTKGEAEQLLADLAAMRATSQAKPDAAE